jgi:hypothetical protein
MRSTNAIALSALMIMVYIGSHTDVVAMAMCDIVCAEQQRNTLDYELCQCIWDGDVVQRQLRAPE